MEYWASFSPSIQGGFFPVPFPFPVPSASSGQLMKSNVQYAKKGGNSCRPLSHIQKGNK